MRSILLTRLNPSILLDEIFHKDIVFCTRVACILYKSLSLKKAFTPFQRHSYFLPSINHIILVLCSHASRLIFFSNFTLKIICYWYMNRILFFLGVIGSYNPVILQIITQSQSKMQYMNTVYLYQELVRIQFFIYHE